MQARKHINIEKKVDVLFVDPKRVEEYWPLVQFMLREGLKYDGDPMSLQDFFDFEVIMLLISSFDKNSNFSSN